MKNLTTTAAVCLVAFTGMSFAVPAIENNDQGSVRTSGRTRVPNRWYVEDNAVSSSSGTEVSTRKRKNASNEVSAVKNSTNKKSKKQVPSLAPSPVAVPFAIVSDSDSDSRSSASSHSGSQSALHSSPEVALNSPIVDMNGSFVMAGFSPFKLSKDSAEKLELSPSLVWQGTYDWFGRMVGNSNSNSDSDSDAGSVYPVSSNSDSDAEHSDNVYYYSSDNAYDSSSDAGSDTGSEYSDWDADSDSDEDLLAGLGADLVAISQPINQS